ncbi:unnamed protein product [Microthlaspi erraticum]|uniref:Uncharacterized protein n=1 Tax=Microthlaspi erraticum TaxID=1685480 RepID=A0A6D2IUX0_9BRAS|nr:unnamed protein product [Microthlaspi erraticum]
MKDLREEELDRADRAEDRAELELRIRSRRVRIWRIGLLQKFNKWQGKAIEKMQKSMDKMVSKIKVWRRKFLVLQARRSPRPPLSLGVDHSSPLQGGSLPKSLTEPLLSSQGEGETTRREGGRAPRPDAPARPPDSIESKQRKLNSIELTVELTWRSPCLRTRDSSTIPAYQDFPEMDPYKLRASSSTKAKGATHTLMKKRKKRSHKLDRAKFGGANSSSIELGVKTRKVVFWSILEHMGHEEHGGTWHMDAAQLDTQRKKGEAILKTSSTPLDQPVEFLNSTGQASTRSS